MDIADLTHLLESTQADGITASHPDFLAAAEAAKDLKGLENEQRLQLYGLFKQATVGDVNTSKPWFTDPVGVAKWYGSIIL